MGKVQIIGYIKNQNSLINGNCKQKEVGIDIWDPML